MKKRILSMMLCCIMVTGLFPNMAFAASKERTLVLTDNNNNYSCASLTGQIKETSIDTVPIIGKEDTDTYPLFIAENGVTLTVAEELADSEYRYEYTACLTRRDFADDGSVDWTHLEEYEENPQIITAADGAVALADGAYCLEIQCQESPQIAMVSSVYCYTPVRVFLRVGLGMNIDNPFSDVPANSYFCTPVLWAIHRGITNGTSATTFSPGETCNRAQIITFLYRAAGAPEPQKEVEILDVPANSYYYMAAQWAAEKGMFEGNTFEPDAPCTRLMAVEFMWKADGSPDAAESGFTDISGSDAVNWAVEAGVTKGTSETTFSPDEICNRGQIVTFLYRAFYQA